MGRSVTVPVGTAQPFCRTGSGAGSNLQKPWQRDGEQETHLLFGVSLFVCPTRGDLALYVM